MANPADSSSSVGLDYWVRWQVPVCAFIIVAPAVVSLVLINNKRREAAAATSSRSRSRSIRSSDLWLTCWRNLNPLWLLFYRVFAFTVMTYLLYQTVLSFGPFVFFFYTQWTFTLVIIYFALGTIISARGCWLYSKQPFPQNGERDKFMDSEDTTAFKDKETKGSATLSEQQAGFWENLMLSVYQTCAGAVMLTDIVFWCLLLPFMTGENFTLTLLIGYMHSVNAVFLLLDSALNRLPFTWFGFVYFVLWSCSYIVFQWVIHACGVTWWPYPFLELATPWAPLWYFGLALVHVPFYGLYVLLKKAKASVYSRLFPNTYVRVSAEKKQS